MCIAMVLYKFGFRWEYKYIKCKGTPVLCARQEYQKAWTFVTGYIYDHCLAELREEDNADRPNEYIETCIGRSAPLAKVSGSYPPPFTLHTCFSRYVVYMYMYMCIENWVFLCFLSNSFHFFYSYM